MFKHEVMFNCRFTRKSISFNINVLIQLITKFVEYMKSVATYTKLNHLTKYLVLNIYSRKERREKQLMTLSSYLDFMHHHSILFLLVNYDEVKM